MWGHWKGVRESDIGRRISRGFGQGQGASYVPWIQKHDFGSSGVAKELFGIKIPRPHHLLSQIEYKFFLIFEFCKAVLDIREQFPLLDRALVAILAKQMGCKAPTYCGTDTLYVMTTDFLLTVITACGMRLLALAVKPADFSDEDGRARELLALQRHYWAAYNIAFEEINEKQIPDALWRNLRWLRQGAIPGHELQVAEIRNAFLRVLSLSRWKGVPLRDVLGSVAHCLGIPQTTAVRLFKYYTWYGAIETDLFTRINLTMPLNVLHIV